MKEAIVPQMKKGDLIINATLPREIVQLKAQGFAEYQPEPVEVPKPAQVPAKKTN